MDMDIMEEVMGSNDHGHIVKGKRTKRQRPSSPLSVAMTTSSSSVGGGGDGGGGGGHDQRSPTPTTSIEFTKSTEEEEDMANCLILLAQGHNKDDSKRIEESGAKERFISRKFTEAVTTTNGGKAGFYVYECKTCNRCFPSFQALGGHRASHKKPKAMVEEKKMLVLSEDEIQFNNNSPPLPFQIGNKALYGNNKSKVHECSICGSEFSSGQALGGHMRRHRTPTITTTATTTTTTTTTTMTPIISESQESKKPRNVLALDLNLPAPEEDRDIKFSFASKQQPLVFSSSALVDCHY